MALLSRLGLPLMMEMVRIVVMLECLSGKEQSGFRGDLT